MLNQKCPLCGAKIIETAKNFCCENWCTDGKYCKFTIWKSSFGAEFTEQDASDLLDGKRIIKTNRTIENNQYDAEWFLIPGRFKPSFVRMRKGGE